MFEAGALIYRIQVVGAQTFKVEMQQADDAAKKAGKSVSESATSTKKLGDETNKAAPRIRSMRAELMGMSDEAKRSATTVGSAYAGVGAAIIALTAITVKAAIDWESAWAGVTKTVDGTPEQLAQVEQGLRGLTRELPATHAEIAAVAEAAGQLGVKAEDITAFTKTMVDLGETTNLTSDEAATSLAQFMNVMRTAPKDVGRLGAAVVALGNDGASTERDIVQMSQRIAGAAKVIGLTEGETLGLANALSSVGIEAEAGGSSVSAIMIDIAKAVSANGDDLQKWAKVAGVSAEEFGRRWKADPAEALTMVIEGMGRLNAAGGDVFATLSDLGQSDIRVTRSLLSLAGAGDLLRDSLELGNQAWIDNSALQTEAAKRYKTTAAQLGIMRNQVTDAAIDFGYVFLPAVVDSAEAVAGFAQFLAELPQPIQEGTALTALFVGGLVLFRGAMLLAIPKIVEFRVAMAALSTEMPVAASRLKGVMSILGGPWGVALAVAAGGTTILVSEIEKLLVSTQELQNTLKTSTSAASSFHAAMGRKFINPDSEKSREQLNRLNEALLDARENWRDWTKGVSFENQPVLDTVRDIGRGLAELASTDLPAAQRQFALLARETDGSRGQLWALLSNMPEYRDALKEQAATLGINVNTEKEATNQKRLLELASVDNTKVTKDAAEAYLEASDEVAGLQGRLEELVSTILESNDVGMDAVSANTEYAATMDEVRARIAEVQKGAEGYSLGIGDATEATRANREALIEQARDAQEAAAGQFALTSNTADYQKALVDGRQSLIDNAIALGATEEEAQKLADTIFSIPSKSEWQLIANTVPAVAAINGVISAFDGRKITLRVGANGQQTYSRDGRVRYEAEGSVRTAANGYVEPMSHQQAQMQRGGSYVLWAEDETEGETFVPHAKSKRAQAEQYMQKTAQIFGGTYIPAGAARMADGGMLGAASALDVSEVRPVTINLTVKADDPATVAALVVQNIEARVRLV